MKLIKYTERREVNLGSEENPNIVEQFYDISVEFSEKNEEAAKTAAYNGEITIEEDGKPEPKPTQAEQLRADVDELREALNMILTGVTE